MNAALSRESTGLIHSRTVGMMHLCITGQLLSRDAFVHQEDKGHTALKHNVSLKGLMGHEQVKSSSEQM